MAENVVRGCDTCGQDDDHPRHLVYLAIQDPRYPDQQDKFIDLTTVKHLDCCAADGCHDKSCDDLLKAAPEGAKGDELRAFLTSLPPTAEVPAHPIEMQPPDVAAAMRAESSSSTPESTPEPTPEATPETAPASAPAEGA